MELCIPSRKIVKPRPVCPKCGGLCPSYLGRHRQHMGFVYHRACCCAPEPVCRETLTLDFTGVDVAMCTDCYIGPQPSGESFKYDNLAVDGSYSVTDQGQVGAECRASGSTSGSGFLDVIFYATDETCSFNPTTYNSEGVSYFVTYLKVTGELQQVSMTVSTTVDGGIVSTDVFDWQHFGDPTARFIGDTVSNQLACGTPYNGSDGGTCTVTTP